MFKYDLLYDRDIDMYTIIRRSDYRYYPAWEIVEEALTIREAIDMLKVFEAKERKNNG